MPPVKVISLNLCAMPNHGRIQEFAELIAKQEADIVLMQECLRSWLPIVCETAGLDGRHAHFAPPSVPTDTFSPDGCAIAVRAPVEVIREWRPEASVFYPEEVRRALGQDEDDELIEMPERLADRYSGRAMFAEVALDGQHFVVASLHGTPGTGEIGKRRVGKRKTFYPGGIATELAKLELPFIFAIDANEPKRENEEKIQWHWDGHHATRIEALLDPELARHRGQDLQRLWLQQTEAEPENPEYLALTYTTRGGAPRRFDHMWATPEFELHHFQTHYEDVCAIGGDHALLVAELSGPTT